MEDTITITLTKERLEKLERIDLNQTERKKLEKYRLKTEIAELEAKLAILKEDFKELK